MAGLHVTALVKSPVDLDQLVKNAREHAVGIYTLTEFYMGAQAQPGLIFGYGAIDERRITEGLAILSKL